MNRVGQLDRGKHVNPSISGERLRSQPGVADLLGPRSATHACQAVGRHRADRSVKTLLRPANADSLFEAALRRSAPPLNAFTILDTRHLC